MLSNREKILQLAAELKAAADHHRELQKKSVEAKRSKSIIWKKRRSTLMEIEGLGGFKEAGYATFQQFCKQELGDRNIPTYTAELTMGYFEKIVFEVPICTYDRHFFVHTKCYPCGFSIRRSRGAAWEFVTEEIDRAKSAWAIARKLAAQNDRALPDKNDLGMAIAQITGKEFEPHLSRMEKAQQTIEALQQQLAAMEETQKNAELEDFYNSRLLQAQSTIENLQQQLAATELQKTPNLEEFRNKQKDIYQRIDLHCQSTIQTSTALRLLIIQGTDAAEKYLLSLVANKYQRAA